MNKNRILYFCLMTFLQAGAVHANPNAMRVNSIQQSANTIKGTVVDTKGEPLLGVTIKKQGDATGCTTDLDGNFSIAAKTGDVLIISYVGFTTQKVTVKNTQSLKVVMAEDAQSLNEVVVVGYGTAKKSDLTGSVESIKADKLNQSSSANALQMLRGQVTGLYINSSNQDPGATNTTLLRGVGSLSGSSEPLVVIDGLPISDMQVSTPSARIILSRLTY